VTEEQFLKMVQVSGRPEPNSSMEMFNGAVDTIITTATTADTSDPVPIASENLNTALLQADATTTPVEQSLTATSVTEQGGQDDKDTISRDHESTSILDEIRL